MKRRRRVLIVTASVALLCSAVPRGIATPPRSRTDEALQNNGGSSDACVILRAEDNDRFQVHGKPLIYGRTLRVPRMRVRVRDSEENRSLEIQRLRILYAWEWLDYPFPGRELGGWTAAWDQAECNGARAGTTVQVPVFDIQPRGYYDGRLARYPFARLPHVTRIVLDVLVTDSCERKVQLSPGDVTRLSRDVVVITTSCAPASAGTDRSARLRFERAR